MTMQFGIMNRGQYNWGDDMPTRFQELMAQARHAEALGYDSFMKGSHFSSKPLHDLNQATYLARVMVECPSLRLIAGIVLMPLHKPLDIAEQFANIDLMSGGKLIFGCGLGYRDEEFMAFGIERKNIVRHMEENITAVRRLWTEEDVNMKGLGWELVNANFLHQTHSKPARPSGSARTRTRPLSARRASSTPGSSRPTTASTLPSVSWKCTSARWTPPASPSRMSSR